MSDINLTSLKSLLIFKRLYETGNATQTAKDLGITQSGVSRSLAQLEENIGFALFMRHKKRLIVLPEADELYGEILGLVSNLENMNHSIVALREFGASRIRIACAPSLGFDYVPKTIARILSDNPKYSVYLDIMPSPEIVRAVEAGNFDVGFVTLPVTTEALVVDEFISTEAVCLIPRNHSLARASVVTTDDLKGQHLVIPNQPNLAADQLLVHLSERNIHIAGKTEANISAICSLVANGVGITLINPITAYDHQAMHAGLLMKPFKPAIHFRFALVYKQKWANNRLISLLKEMLPDLPDHRVAERHNRGCDIT
ncbi:MULTISPECIES: LysR family transcriptional regulator [Marinobacter]|uniref:LysR family transcriptional regulator n=1 Tax=Marinobacter suaedae TaxID=3057675 RepID=A0ABT8VVV9_9GAMM|nr:MULTISPECIES: LysR family transcriptional regulator [unclassified Marinobacter]MBZ2168254.1 LysR family transcriptional regulator [Marinobacter sp. F4216]MDO3720127.1 LysR family transcriptional regulator [Marinobacter sp. chi1]